MDEIHSRLDIREERISEIEDSKKKSSILKCRGKNDWKNNEQNLHEVGTQ